MLRSRDETLALLAGAPISRRPVFGGLPSLTEAGLRTTGIRYSDAHTDAARMADAAATTYEVCGFESAVVPFDLCVEAQALGCAVDFQTDVPFSMPPVIAEPLSRFPNAPPRDPARAGRIPQVGEALVRLRAGVGREIAVGAWVPGPFTLAWQIFGGEGWFAAMGDHGRARGWLEALADFLARVGVYYRESGADFLTVHEMGGSPQAVGPTNFRALVQPSLTKLVSRLPSPKVLSICGDTNAAVLDIAACGADALNVDHLNDLGRTHELLPTLVLLGNLDPVDILSRGTPEQVAAAVRVASKAGASAIWSGCDLVPDMPRANLKAWVASAGQNTPN